MADPHNLERFVAAQARVYDDVLAELRNGRKTTHWMWFVFPQIAGLGQSSTSRFYALAGIEEARAYLEHPTLGPRLREAASIVAASSAPTAEAIFGGIDTQKLRSSMTLFARADPGETAFQAVLSRYFDGEPDPATLERL